MARVIVAGKYQLLKKIGAGSFGKIFAAKALPPLTPPFGENVEAMDVSKNGGIIGDTPFAIKIISIDHSLLWQNEVMIYNKLRDLKYIPSLYAVGTEGKFNYIVMDLLDQSVEELRINYGEQSLPLKVVIHLGLQMLNIVEQIHARGIIHCDLKPANFLLKSNAQQISELYLIDFGLAHSFLDEKSRHSTIKTNETLVGTSRYMSVNVHQGLTASRRDDLESLGYILLFLYQGKLSWQKQSAVAEIKQQFNWTVDTLGELVLFILYCRNLGFADKPNYAYLRGLLENLTKLT